MKYVSQASTAPLTTAPRSSTSPPSTLTHTPLVTPEPSKWWGDRILEALGIHSLSDDELLAKLKNTRDAHLRRISILEKEMEEKKREDSDDSGGDS